MTTLTQYSPEWFDAYYAGMLLCGDRYLGMATQKPERFEELIEFIREYRDGVMNCLPLMKLNRWLGYIQRFLIESGMTTVTEERDYTRPLFRPLDF